MSVLIHSKLILIYNCVSYCNVFLHHESLHIVNQCNLLITDLKESDDLPSIKKFEDGLENDESSLGTEKPPPLLYENLQQREMHKYVEELRQSVADEEIAAYLEEFERKVEEEIIEIGEISLEDVQVSI